MKKYTMKSLFNDPEMNAFRIAAGLLPDRLHCHSPSGTSQLEFQTNSYFFAPSFKKKLLLLQDWQEVFTCKCQKDFYEGRYILTTALRIRCSVINIICFLLSESEVSPQFLNKCNWFVYTVQSVGGLVVAASIKYADNILKGINNIIPVNI